MSCECTLSIIFPEKEQKHGQELLIHRAHPVKTNRALLVLLLCHFAAYAMPTLNMDVV